MKIMLVGDSHGDSQFLQNIFARAARESCDIIVQLGDFGFWPHTEWGKKFVKNVDKFSVKYGPKFYWLDGNHENHTFLRENFDVAAGVEVKITKNITYLPRGYSWVWDSVRFMSFGGAYSIDKADRTEGISYWPEELITYGEVRAILDHPKVKILLTHDAPSFVPLKDIIPGFFKADIDSASNRKMVSEVVDIVQPRLLVHGHYHYRYSHNVTPYHGYPVQVEGLACNFDSFGDTFITLDTKDWNDI